jgi:hypothetical protein
VPTKPATDRAAPAVAEPKTVTFGGRDLTVSMPTPEQLAVWQRTARRMTGVDPATMTGEEAMKLLDRGLKVIQSVLPNPDDRDWLEDELLDGNLTLEAAAGIVTAAVAAYRTNGGPPKTGPVKKARRAR